MARFDTYSSLFKNIKQNIEKSFDEITEEIIGDWRELVWTEFYLAYEPRTYVRSYQVLNSISQLNIVKNNNKIEIEIGYDESKITTFQNGLWTAHENPSIMGQLVESGGIYGHDPDGIRALERIVNELNNGELKRKFKDRMKEKGYIVKN